jgi:prepilin-type N-terminal cleavage/methylation domain-containing protein
MSRSRSPDNGFSLIELVLVMAIISIVAAIALPRYSNGIQNYRALVSAKRVAADLQMAQTRARMTSASRTVTFTLASSSYQIAGESDLKTSASTYTVSLVESPYRARLTSVDFGGGSASITFNSFGMPSGSGTITLSAGNVTKKVVLSAYTGAVTIQ